MRASFSPPAAKIMSSDGPYPFHQAYTYVMDNLAPITVEIEGDNWYMFPIIFDGTISVGIRMLTPS